MLVHLDLGSQFILLINMQKFVTQLCLFARLERRLSDVSRLVPGGRSEWTEWPLEDGLQATASTRAQQLGTIALWSNRWALNIYMDTIKK